MDAIVLSSNHSAGNFFDEWWKYTALTIFVTVGACAGFFLTFGPKLNFQKFHETQNKFAKNSFYLGTFLVQTDLKIEFDLLQG